MDSEEIKKNIYSILKEIEEDPKREGLLETPKRVAETYKTLFSGYEKDPKDIIKTFDAENYDGMVICKNIDFFSTCEHHILPFFGKGAIAYIPNEKIIGISKLPRLVEVFSRRLQNQERIARQVAETIQNLINPKGVAVVLEGLHLCMLARGIKKANAKMTTTYFLGEFKKDSSLRDEFLTQAYGNVEKNAD